MTIIDTGREQIKQNGFLRRTHTNKINGLCYTLLCYIVWRKMQMSLVFMIIITCEGTATLIFTLQLLIHQTLDTATPTYTNKCMYWSKIYLKSTRFFNVTISKFKPKQISMSNINGIYIANKNFSISDSKALSLSIESTTSFFSQKQQTDLL